jgi:hypothetical protein
MGNRQSLKSNYRLKYDKRVYRLWFEFLKRAYQDDGVSVNANFYRDWGDVLNTKASDWWEEHWIDLFAEKESTAKILSDDEVSITSHPAKLYLEVPINKPLTNVVNEVKELIKPSFEKVKSGRKRVYPSTANFQVTLGAEIDIDSFRMMLRCYHIKKQGIRTKDIPNKVRERIFKIQERQRREGRREATAGIFASDDNESLNRSVQRYIQRANRIIKNVARGEFPGSY